MKRAMILAPLLGLLLAAPLRASADADPKTERLWKSKCASCHGADGKAATEQGKKMKMRDLTTDAEKKKLTEAYTKQVILDGYNKEEDGVKKEMEGYKDKLKPEQVDALVGFVRGLKK